jgi:hypothetical protein
MLVLRVLCDGRFCDGDNDIVFSSVLLHEYAHPLKLYESGFFCFKTASLACEFRLG